VQQPCQSTVTTLDVKLGFVQQMFVGNTLLHFYAAMRPREILGGFFDEMVVMNTVSWNSVGGGHISQLAFRLLSRGEPSTWPTCALPYVG
jgi:hypothetical protein